jgi:YfiR/HmsC-like
MWRLLALLVAWACAGGRLAAQVQTQALTEYEAKAGFLYHFGGFVDWPARAFTGTGNAFIIGVLGADPFGDVLDEVMQGKMIHNKPVIVKRFVSIEDAVFSHILFVSSSETSRLPSILEALDGASILTVSELDRFAERGGMIALNMVGKKMRFDINMNAAKRAKLKLSSQLLKLARVVHGAPGTRE